MHQSAEDYYNSKQNNKEEAMKIIDLQDSSLDQSSTKLQKEFFMCEDIIMNHY